MLFVSTLEGKIHSLSFQFDEVINTKYRSPSRHYFGAKTWANPGAFRNGFPGLCACFVNAAFSFGGTELVGLAAAETADPVKTLPKATKQVCRSSLLFLLLHITNSLIGVLENIVFLRH